MMKRLTKRFTETESGARPPPAADANPPGISLADTKSRQ
jgi:hypothetical protein